MKHALTTENLKSSERLSYWNDVICATYVKLECDTDEKALFHGNIISYQLPDLDFSVVNAAGHTVNRTNEAISKESDSWVIASFHTKGKGRIIQDGREALLNTGNFAIYDSTRPYTLQMDDEFEQIVLKIRLNDLATKLACLEDLTATAISTTAGVGQFLVNMLYGLKTEADSMNSSSAKSVTSSVVNLLTGGLQSIPNDPSLENSKITNYHINRIRQTIDDQLQNPKFSLQALADHIGLSTSHIHRLFHTQPESPSQYLWRRRLESCQQEIFNPHNRKESLSTIAFAWGFNDAAHFSRAYRAHFGATPSQHRRSIFNH